MIHQNTICLVDGSGYIFRAFYALPAMTRSDGTPVGAVYGFINMLMNLVRESGCDHIVVVFDAKRHNFRNEIFADYKANRGETPPELVPQFPLIRQATEAFNIPWVEMEGYEADDLIATYARIAAEKGWNARIISADKDLMQLMNDKVSLYDPLKRKQLTEEDVKEKFGVTPDKVVDVQALMGDSIDNIPGATGIGPKTAAELINRFGSLDKLLQNLSDITQPKRREGLIRDTKQILVSKQLVTLDSHAPVNEDLTVFKTPVPDYDKILNFLQEQGFKSLIERSKNWTRKQTDGLQPPSTFFNEIKTSKTLSTIETPTTVTYELVQDEEHLKKWIERIYQKKIVAVDTETTSLDVMRAKMVGFSLCCEMGHACYVPLRHGGDEDEKSNGTDLFSFAADRPKQLSVKKALTLLKPILEDKSIIKVGHNIKYDMHIFGHEYGTDFMVAPIEDTMLMSYTLYGTTHGHGMDELAKLYLHHDTIKYIDVCGKGRKQLCFDQVELDVAKDYAAEDADITMRLFQFFKPQLDEDKSLKKVYTDIDLPLIPILFKMEQAGILVDRDQLNNLNVYFIKEIERLTKEIHVLANEEFNLNSPAQLGVILFEKMGLEGGKKGTSGAWLTDMKVLEKLAEEGIELAQKVLEYRSFSKLKTTYVDALLALIQPPHERVHTSFILTGTNTGRLASSDPNLQNIPIRTEAGKEIRKAFIAKEGYKLVSADYSQIELRLIANLGNVKLLKEALLSGEDVHAATASQVFGIPLPEIDADTRRKAKAINFGIMYGQSAFGLAAVLNISRTEARQYIDAYFEKYPEMKQYMEQTIMFAHEHGYVLTPYGRKCFINGINEKGMRGFAERAAINAPLQGGAADIIKMAMVKVAKDLKSTELDATLLLQVHDELIFEVADKDVEAAKVIIKNAMENVVKLDVPLIAEVGVGHNWKDAH